jgi:NADPH-dependent curcumin reductase
MNRRGRVVQCGTAAVAAWNPPPRGPRHERMLLVGRLRHEGFIVFDHAPRYAEVIGQLASLSKAGALVFREDIEAGLECAPAALASLFRGENRGKKLVQIVDGERSL